MCSSTPILAYVAAAARLSMGSRAGLTPGRSSRATRNSHRSREAKVRFHQGVDDALPIGHRLVQRELYGQGQSIEECLHGHAQLELRQGLAKAEMSGPSEGEVGVRLPVEAFL